MRTFIAKWGPGGSAFELNERAGAQAHFIDLCRLLPALPDCHMVEWDKMPSEIRANIGPTLPRGYSV